jgi:hypothetical protein
MSNENPTQAHRLLKALQESEEGVSAYEAALRLGIWRCAARVYELRSLGYNISMSREPNMTARYRLEEKR